MRYWLAVGLAVMGTLGWAAPAVNQLTIGGGNIRAGAIEAKHITTNGAKVAALRTALGLTIGTDVLAPTGSGTSLTGIVDLASAQTITGVKTFTAEIVGGYSTDGLFTPTYRLSPESGTIGSYNTVTLERATVEAGRVTAGTDDGPFTTAISRDGVEFINPSNSETGSARLYLDGSGTTLVSSLPLLVTDPQNGYFRLGGAGGLMIQEGGDYEASLLNGLLTIYDPEGTVSLSPTNGLTVGDWEGNTTALTKNQITLSEPTSSVTLEMSATNGLKIEGLPVFGENSSASLTLGGGLVVVDTSPDVQMMLVASPTEIKMTDARDSNVPAFYVDKLGNVNCRSKLDTPVVMVSSRLNQLQKTPASRTAPGTVGDICWDANYIYVCTGANNWKRVAISTW